MAINALDFNAGAAPGGNGQCVGAILGLNIQDAAGDNIMIVGGNSLIIICICFVTDVCSPSAL